MIKKIALITVFTLGLVVRLYNFNGPIADWHSHRQADTSSVTRNFINQGINLFSPTYHDLSNVQSGKANPVGYRLVELPLYNVMAALLYQPFNSLLTIETSQRFITILLSLGTGLFIFLIAYKLFKNFEASFFALSAFLFLPFNIYYSRTILPEPLAVFFMTASLYLLVNQKIVLSSLPLALAILIKPYTALILFPIILYYCWGKPLLKVILLGMISLTPFILWRLWISQHPEGIPASDWLFNGGNIRFRPAWFRWLFDERLAKLILGSFGLIPLFLGLAYKKDKSQKFLLLLITGVVIYFSVIARGNVQHDYYQVLIIPVISLLLGSGFYYIHHFVFSKTIFGLLSGLAIFIIGIAFSAYQVKEYYKINNPIIIEAGQKTDQLLPKNAIVIAPYTGDTAFLYQTNRPGWPTESYDIPEVKKLVSPRPLYLTSVNFDQYTNMMIQKYPTLYRTDKYIILNLNQ